MPNTKRKSWDASKADKRVKDSNKKAVKAIGAATRKREEKTRVEKENKRLRR